MNFDELWQVGLDHKIQQKKEEFIWLIDKILHIPNYNGIGIDIGSYDGGTTASFSYICKQLYTLDINPQRFNIEKFNKDCQYTYLEGNSHLEENKNVLATLLNGKKVDFLFIDGDHMYSGVKQDFEMYREFVSPNGLIAFHDIVKHPDPSGCTVEIFWNEIKQSGLRYEEKVVSPSDWGGISVIFNRNNNG